jgi:hypothetical protein
MIRQPDEQTFEYLARWVDGSHWRQGCLYASNSYDAYQKMVTQLPPGPWVIHTWPLGPMKEKTKDTWGKLNSISGLATALLVALIGGFFTLVYRGSESRSLASQEAQELRVLQVQTIQNFMPHLNSSDKRTQELALLAIAALGNDELATKLAGLLRTEGAISALPKIVAGNTSATNQAVSSLTQVLQDPSSDVRAQAAHALEQLGQSASSSVVSRLIVLLEGGDPDVAAVAARALKALGPEALKSIASPNQ